MCLKKLKSGQGVCKRKTKVGSNYCWQHSFECRICYDSDISIEKCMTCENCNKQTCRDCVVNSKSTSCPHCRHEEFLNLATLSDEEYLSFHTPFDYTDTERLFDEEHGVFEFSAEDVREHNIQQIITELVAQEAYYQENMNDVIYLYDIIGDPDIIIRLIRDAVASETPNQRISLALSLAVGSVRRQLLSLFSLSL